MIDLTELRRIARIKGITNLGYAEKDYFQEIVLLALSRESTDLVFKGGTALSKCYGLDRFSEDLDFSGVFNKKLLKKIIDYLNAFGAPTEMKTKNVFDTTLVTLRINGILYRGSANTTCKLRIDINRRSTIVLQPEKIRIFSRYPDIPSFVVQTMQEKEILTEKVRALLTRNRARDLYDLWFLIKKGIPIELELIKNKLTYYKLEFDIEVFLQSLKKRKDVWEKELKPFVSSLPEFEIVLKEVSNEF